ncbi:MAG TPA: aspartate aminotransferase family protein [Dehalococcoidia bacterium]|nr:aspartate aminotransferase family protein [Dehalococcoidia bacterium]
MTTTTQTDELARADLEHLIHPLYHPAAQQGAVIFARGEGVWLWDTNGKRYLDGLSCLWNVNIGHGRKEVAEAAREQMSTLAFANGYTGFSNVPAIRLAERLAKLAPGDLNAVFFTSGGGESNESAFKMARFLWNVQGKPEKFKVIARFDAYHGVTTAAMAATGMAPYWERFGPPAPGFLHAAAPNPYRLGDGPEETAKLALDSIEAIVAREGAETIAAIIAEPIQGAGGVIIPPDAYMRGLRELCDRHQFYLVADEVITGFGRTGTWFGMEQFGVQADMMSFAKGVTSGYQQLGGLMVSERIQAVLAAQPPDVKWMHAYTYSAHPTACAVAMANLDIIERDGLVRRSAELGEKLLARLEELRELPNVGDVRGRGLLARVELVDDVKTRQAFPAAAKIGDRVITAARGRGLLTRNRGDVIALAPPLCITEDEIEFAVTALRDAIREVVATRA